MCANYEMLVLCDFFLSSKSKIRGQFERFHASTVKMPYEEYLEGEESGLVPGKLALYTCIFLAVNESS